MTESLRCWGIWGGAAGPRKGYKQVLSEIGIAMPIPTFGCRESGLQSASREGHRQHSEHSIERVGKAALLCMGIIQGMLLL